MILVPYERARQRGGNGGVKGVRVALFSLVIVVVSVLVVVELVSVDLVSVATTGGVKGMVVVVVVAVFVKVEVGEVGGDLISVDIVSVITTVGGVGAVTAHGGIDCGMGIAIWFVCPKAIDGVMNKKSKKKVQQESLTQLCEIEGREVCIWLLLL